MDAFEQVELFGAASKVKLGGFFHAVYAGTELDDVDVNLEDSILGEVFL